MAVQCQGCKTVSFFHRSWCSEDIRWNEETEQEEPIPTDKLYPSRVYRQTHAAICNNLNILAGVGMRTIVEAVCTEKAAKGGDLKERIDDLVTLGFITNDGANILHSIRLMGNKAAHEAKANSQAELGIALDVIEHLLRGVYVLPGRASKL